jgi:hypothetical protein
MAIALTPAIVRLLLLHHSVDPTCNYSNLTWYSFGLRESGQAEFASETSAAIAKTL